MYSQQFTLCYCLVESLLLRYQSITPFLSSAPPPTKNPGSASEFVACYSCSIPMCTSPHLRLISWYMIRSYRRSVFSTLEKKVGKFCSWRSIREMCQERRIRAFLKPENLKRKKYIKIQNTDPLWKYLKNGKLRDFNPTFALHFLACG